jgi:hypothetical protein
MANAVRWVPGVMCQLLTLEHGSCVWLLHGVCDLVLPSAAEPQSACPLSLVSHYHTSSPAPACLHRRVSRLLNTAIYTFQGGFDRQLREVLGPRYPPDLLPHLAAGANAAIQVSSPLPRSPACRPRRRMPAAD